MPRLEVRIPANTPPGATMVVQDPNGRQISLMIPLNRRPGEILIVDYDDGSGYLPPPQPPPQSVPAEVHTYVPFPQPSAHLLAQQQAPPTMMTTEAAEVAKATAFPQASPQLQAQQQPVIHVQPIQALQPGVMSAQMPSQGNFTLVYDGHGSYIQAYNVTTEKKFGVKSSIVCLVLAFVCLPAACFVPCFPCDEVVMGHTADGRTFMLDR